MPSNLRNSQDEDVSDYEPSDSDEDYDENAKLLLKNLRGQTPDSSDNEEEILGVNQTDSEDDDHSDIALSDVEGQDDDDLPDVRAWGKDKRKFYSTDFVDPDYFGFQGKSAQLAELEEEEARNLQKQLAEQLDDDDFTLEIDVKKKVDDNKEFEELIKTDITKLSKRQKLDILKKESPEFFGLVEDFETKMNVVRDFLQPCLRKYKKGQIPNCSALEFVETFYNLNLSYCTNIYMYLLLKSSRVNVGNHPVVKRLFQYRKLLEQMNPSFEEIIKPQIELLLVENEETKNKKKKLSILKKLTKNEEKKKKAVKVAILKDEKSQEIEQLETEDHEDKEEEEEMDVDTAEAGPSNENDQDTTKDLDRRAITYQIAKNKGLTPYRKKELRNPRVKHRNKFRKALIRRKGAVREARTEMKRYSGEASGIKATVTKSIKIKS